MKFLKTAPPAIVPVNETKENRMNYKMAIIILGGLLFVAAMVPYAYAPRCSSPSECPTTAPY